MRRVLISLVFAALVGLSGHVGAEIIESIAASVNGEIIFESELDQTMRWLLSSRRPMEKISEDEYNRLRFDVFRKRAREILLSQECRSILKERGYDDRLTEREINRLTEENKARYRAKFDSDEAMHQNMEKEGITEESLQTECLQMARQQYWLQVVAPQLVQGRVSPVSQEETEEFKTAHPNDWMKYESIRVSHILLRVPEGTPAAEEEKIKEKAETISLRAQAGEDFAVLAREFSQHEETRGKGGSLGEIRRAETFPEFDPLFDLLLGKPSAPIRTKLGYHIALVSERISLPDYLRRQKSQQALNDWVEEIVNRSETEILYKGDVRQDLLTDSAEGTERP